MNVSAWVGVILFTVATGGFAIEPQVDDVQFQVGIFRPQPSLNQGGIQPGLSDAVTKEKNLIAAFDGGVRKRLRGGVGGIDGIPANSCQ